MVVVVGSTTKMAEAGLFNDIDDRRVSSRSALVCMYVADLKSSWFCMWWLVNVTFFD